MQDMSGDGMEARTIWSTVVAVGALLVVFGTEGQADIRSRTDVAVTSERDDEAGPAHLRFAVPVPELPSDQRFQVAELRFRAEAIAGDEVELWLDLGDGSRPWEVEGDTPPQPVAKWLVDDRTGLLVRFDVTGILDVWGVSRAASGDLLLRLCGADGEQKELILADVLDIRLVVHLGKARD